MRLFVSLPAVALLGALLAGNSLAAQPRVVIDGVSARVFNQMLGIVDADDVLVADYLPYNQLGVGLFVVATVNLGAECRLASVTSSEGSGVVRGEALAASRPSYCARPTGTLRVTLKYADGTQDSKSLALAQFSGGDDGRIHVPFLFYRKQLCSPLELSATIPGSSKSFVKKVDFRCAE